MTPCHVLSTYCIVVVLCEHALKLIAVHRVVAYFWFEPRKTDHKKLFLTYTSVGYMQHGPPTRMKMNCDQRSAGIWETRWDTSKSREAVIWVFCFCVYLGVWKACGETKDPHRSQTIDRENYFVCRRNLRSVWWTWFRQCHKITTAESPTAREARYNTKFRSLNPCSRHWQSDKCGNLWSGRIRRINAVGYRENRCCLDY